MKDIKRQHYVWRFYLKPWTNSNKIWCMRNNSIFNTTLMNIAQEKYFYKKSELNQNEISLIFNIIKSFPAANHSLMFDTFRVYLASSNGNEFLKKNGLEIYHGIVEKRGINILNNAYKGDISVLENDETRIEFSKFVARQHSRTKKIHKNILTNIDKLIPPPGDYENTCDMNKIMDALNFLTSDSLGNWIYSQSKIYLLTNDTKTHFLACDQPVFNLKAHNNKVPDDIELFYPISPDKAFLFSTAMKIETNLSEADVKKYNSFIISKSYEFLFSKSKEGLCNIIL